MTDANPPEAAAAEPSLPVVRHSTVRGAVEAWSLVLSSQGINHHIVERAVVESPDGLGAPLRLTPHFLLVVQPQHLRRAAVALARTDAEDAERARTPDAPPPDRGLAIAPLVVCAALAVFFLVSGPRSAHSHWFSTGSADASAIMKGAWYRATTGLTLHSDAMHLLGNIAAMLIFLGAAGRWMGGGVAFALTLLAGFLGNWSTAAFYGAAHNSVGASTATFAALGILGGLQARHRVKFGWWHRSNRIGRMWRAVAACLALFAMLGVGGPQVDVLAHATGLAWGFVLGLGASFLPPFRAWGNVAWGVLGAVFVAFCWARVLVVP